jgi:hypothetical protein
VGQCLKRRVWKRLRMMMMRRRRMMRMIKRSARWMIESLRRCSVEVVLGEREWTDEMRRRHFLASQTHFYFLTT